MEIRKNFNLASFKCNKSKLQFFDPFSEHWYLSKYPDVAVAVERGDFPSGRIHFRKRGQAENRSPGPAFDSEWYIGQLTHLDPDHREGPRDLMRHYFSIGQAKQISPHWLFDEEYYRRQNPDVDEAVKNANFTSGFHHYINHVSSETFRRGHPLFSAYIHTHYSGVGSGENPFIHFLEGGSGERSMPTPLFDLEWYLHCSSHAGANSTLGHVSVGTAALEEFIKSGFNDHMVPCPDFDSDYYARNNPDVGQAKAADGLGSFFKHWLYFGLQEGRDPNRFFNSAYYLARNPAAAREIRQWGLLGAFEHFLFIGRSRGYRCNTPQINLPVDEEQAKAVFLREAHDAANRVIRDAPVSLPEVHESPQLSLVIPVLDNFEFTAQLLLQLSIDAPPRTEIIVVDNGSTDKTQDLESYFTNLVYIRNGYNVGFPAACNQGCKSARAPTVILMNNDIRLGSEALARVKRAFACEDNVGAVGARIIRSHGLLQEGGSIIWSDGSTQGYGRDFPAYHSNVMKRRAVDFCSACFLAVEKGILEELGGLSEQYSPGYYEEVDLCARIWASGRRVIYEPEIYITHFEYGSFSKGRPPSSSHNAMRQKRKIFIERQPQFLKAQPASGRVHPVFLIDREKRAKKRLLLVDDYPPIPQLGSGFVRTQNLIEELGGLDIDIILISFLRPELPEFSLINRYLPNCELIFYDELRAGLADFVMQNNEKLSGVWISRTHNLARFHKDLVSVSANCPGLPLILDTEALSTLREMAKPDSGALGLAEEDYYETQLKRELNGANLFDLMIAVNSLEEEKLKAVVPGVNGIVIGHRRKRPRKLPEFEETRDFLFVGAIHGDDTPNFDSLVWFIRSAWPLVRNKLGPVNLSVIGFCAPEVEFPADIRAAPGVVWRGRVESLEDWYENSRVFIAPTRFAAGIPFKVHEAVSMGLPTVISDLLAGQLGWKEGDGVSVAQVSNPDAFAEACVGLYLNQEMWSEYQSQGQEIMDRDASGKRFADGVREVAKLLPSPSLVP